MLKKLFIIISAIVISICLFILFIGPIVVNQIWFKDFVENQIHQNIKTPLEINKIHFSWSEGVSFDSAILFPEFPSDTPFIIIEKTVARIRFISFFEFKPEVMINLHGIKVNFIRYSDQTNNLSNWLERLNQNQNKENIDHSKKKQNKSFVLPFDIKCFLSITGLAIDYQDHLLKKKIAIKDTQLILTSNSILKSAINIQTQSHIDIDHRGCFPLKFSLSVSNLFNKDKRIKIDAGSLFIAQNSKIRWKGEMDKDLSSADIEIGPFVIDCGEIYPKVNSLLPGNALFEADVMPVIKVNRLLLTRDPNNNENRIKVIHARVNSNQFSYKNDQQQLLAQKIALKIPELIVSQKSSMIMDIILKELSLNIPDIEFTHKELGTINESLSLTACINRMCVNKKDLKSSHISGTNVSFQIGNALRIKTDTLDVKNKYMNFIGKATIDLAELSKRLPLFMKKNEIKINGQTELSLHIKGCLPEKNEIEKIPKLSDLNMKKDLPFLDSAELKMGLNKVTFEYKPEKQKDFFLGPVSTRNALRYHYNKKQGTGNISTRLLVKKLDKTFNIKQDKPLEAEIDITARHTDSKKLKLSQEVCIKNWGLKNKIIAQISGLHQFIGEDIQSKVPFWFDYLGGSISNKLSLTDLSKLESLVPGVELKGAINIGSNIDLIPKKRIDVKLFSQTDGIDFSLDQRIGVHQFKAALDLNKTFHIVNSTESEKTPELQEKKYLSLEVMKTSNKSLYVSKTQHPINDRYIGPLQKAHRGQPTFSFRTLQIKTGPLPIEVNHAAIDFGLIDGIPHLESVQFEIWEGTVIASATLIKNENNDCVRFQIDFSGIDFNRILKNEYRDFGNDSEINGQLFTIFPITSHFQEVLNGLDFRLRFSHIGRLALERLLYALDPYENNEVIISQRKLLKTGSPIWIELIVRDGNLSLTGKLSVGGLIINLPPLKRFTVTGISGLETIEKKFIRFEPAFKTIFNYF